MELINQSFEILEQKDFSIIEIKKFIERCGRVCYKSEDKITDNSYEKFVNILESRDHCYDGNTEVMTENGWVKWKEYKGEKVAVINPDFTVKGFENPIRVINKKYIGNFYYYPSLGTIVTEGHTMYGCFLSNRENTYEKFMCNTNFYDQNKRHWTMGERPFRVKTVPNKPSFTNPMYELIGFWLGDGCTNSSTNQLTFHLKKERKIKYLKELADKLGYEFKIRKNNYYCIVYNNIGKYFSTNFVKNKTKYIDLKLSPSSIHSIIIGLINSDGKVCNPISKKQNIYFSTTSEYIKKWILTWAPLAGYTISEGKPTNCYNFTFRTRNVELCNDSRNLERTKVHTFFGSKRVYCVTVSTGLILLRGSNGKSFVCGNCRPLEFGTVHLKMDFYSYDTMIDTLVNKSILNQLWAKGVHKCNNVYITTNYRYYLAIKEVFPDITKFFTEEDNEYFPKRYTVHFILSRGIMDEFRTHVGLSHLAESTRYVSSCQKRSIKEFNCDNIEDICSAYQQGFSMREIALYSSMSENTIRRRLIDNNISIRGLNNKGNRVEDYFSIINTPEKAYLLGIIQTDGNVRISNRNASLTITQHKEYAWYIKDMLLNFSDYVGDTEDRNCRQLQIGSKQIVNDLINIGIVPNKTYVQSDEDIDILWDSIPEEYKGDFIRGLIDGDGNVSFFIQHRGVNESCNIGFVSVKEHLIDILIDYIYKKFNYKCGKYKENNIYRLTITDYKKSLEIGKFLYTNFQYPFGHPKKASAWIKRLDADYPIADYKDNKFICIKPYWLKKGSPLSIFMYIHALDSSEDAYINLRLGGCKPQEARDVLPICIKSELISCGFEDAWQNFFYRRCADNAHPMARFLAKTLQDKFYKTFFETKRPLK